MKTNKKYTIQKTKTPSLQKNTGVNSNKFAFRIRHPTCYSQCSTVKILSVIEERMVFVQNFAMHIWHMLN